MSIKLGRSCCCSGLDNRKTTLDSVNSRLKPGLLQEQRLECWRMLYFMLKRLERTLRRTPPHAYHRRTPIVTNGHQGSKGLDGEASTEFRRRQWNSECECHTLDSFTMLGKDCNRCQSRRTTKWLMTSILIWRPSAHGNHQHIASKQKVDQHLLF